LTLADVSGIAGDVVERLIVVNDTWELLQAEQLQREREKN